MSVTTAKASNLKKVRKQGFRARKATAGGQNILNARRRKGRNQVAFNASKK